jgi:hypothetical protein
VNYRYRHKVLPADLEQLISDIRAGKLAEEIPPHGTLARIRQRTPANWTGTARPRRRRWTRWKVVLSRFMNLCAWVR